MPHGRTSRTGDPNELIDAAEFARIVGWDGGTRTVTSALAAQRDRDLHRRVQRKAAEFLELFEAPFDPDLPRGKVAGRIRRAVGDVLEHDPPATREQLDVLATALAGRLNVPEAAVLAQLARLASPVSPRRSDADRDLPEPVEPADPGGGSTGHRAYRWYRYQAWEHAEGRKRENTPPHYRSSLTDELHEGALQAVREAADGGETLTPEVLAKRLDVPRSGGDDPLLKTKNLLQRAVDVAREQGVDLRTRAEVVSDKGLTYRKLQTALTRPAAPAPAIIINRFMYYRGWEIDAYL